MSATQGMRTGRSESNVLEAAATLQAGIYVFVTLNGGYGTAIDDRLGDAGWSLYSEVEGPFPEEDAYYTDPRIVKMYARTAEIEARMLFDLATAEDDWFWPVTREWVFERAQACELDAWNIRAMGTVAV